MKVLFLFSKDPRKRMGRLTPNFQMALKIVSVGKYCVGVSSYGCTVRTIVAATITPIMPPIINHQHFQLRAYTIPTHSGPPATATHLSRFALIRAAIGGTLNDSPIQPLPLIP